MRSAEQGYKALLGPKMAFEMNSKSLLACEAQFATKNPTKLHFNHCLHCTHSVHEAPHIHFQHFPHMTSLWDIGISHDQSSVFR